MSELKPKWKYCPECKNELTERHQVGPHQECDCGKFLGNNPVSVNVVLQSVRRSDGSIGLLVGVRKIEPGLGLLALPGGYHDAGETARKAAARELFEETGLRVASEKLRFVDLTGNRANTQVILCWLAPEISESELPPFKPNEEVSERLVVSSAENIAFSSQKRWIEKFFSGLLDFDPSHIGLE